MELERRLAAKRLYECAITCPDCAETIRIEAPGWAFGEEARSNPFVEGVACDGACEFYADSFDARELVTAATALDSETRAWVEAYASAADRLLSEIRQAETVATCLGTFFTQTLAAYIGRNPRTGEGVAIPKKCVRLFQPSPEFLTACALPPPRPLTSVDLEDEDILRRYDEDEATAPLPVPTRSVDLAMARDVFLAELRTRGCATVGQIGALARVREHDDEQLFTVVVMRMNLLLRVQSPA